MGIKSTVKPFRVSTDYLDWAHGSAAEEDQPLAVRLLGKFVDGKDFALIYEPALVAEIADVAELYVGGRDTDLRAARVLKRAKDWLIAQGLTIKTAQQLKNEDLGKRCADGGRCHHQCVDQCFRRECCEPFSDYAGPWKYIAK